LDYVSCSNEGESIALNAGACLVGRGSVSAFQNSGLGNAINPLTSLVQINKLTFPLIMSMRGTHFGQRDEPQHELMGKISRGLLASIGYSCFSLTGSKEDENTFIEFLSAAKTEDPAIALLVYKGALKKSEFPALQLEQNTSNDFLQNSPKPSNIKVSPAEMKRAMIIEAMFEHLTEDDIVISTTGYTSREVSYICDRARNFYMVGAMGCASAVGLGIAINRPQDRVFIVDGDGATLMRMGTLATIGHYKPKNLHHILLNNNSHESTGGQRTAGHQSTDFATAAHACGYSYISKISSRSELDDHFNKIPTGPTFFEIGTLIGTTINLPRTSISPQENVVRFRDSLKA